MTDKTGEYKVDLPADPQDIARTADADGLEISVIGKLCEIDNGYISCGVTVSTFPDEFLKDVDASVLLHAVSDQLDASLDKVEVTENPETEFDGFPARMCVATAGEAPKQDRITYRAVKVGNRVYMQILAETSGRRLPPKSRERFLNSFEITAAKPTVETKSKAPDQTPTEPAKAETP